MGSVRSIWVYALLALGAQAHAQTSSPGGSTPGDAGAGGIQSAPIGSGLVTIMVKGDVGAVKAAVDSGVESAQRIGEVVTSLVIARPHNDINKMVIKHKA